MGILERKEREREARRTAILDAAEQIFKLRGFTNSTMDDIAREAELAKGTVYLYYKSKEELQLGLLSRGLEILEEKFAVAMTGKNTAIERMLTVGDAYWNFAEEHLFYFEMMHLMDVPNKTGQVSPEAVATLHEKSNSIWTMLVGEMEKAKVEGTIKPEVNSLAFTIMLWMNATGVLRFHHRVRATPDSVWSERGAEFNMCNIDWRSIYNLNGNLLLHELVTARGLMYLAPIVWPTNMQPGMPVCAPPAERSFSAAFNLAPFVDEEMPMAFYETGV